MASNILVSDLILTVPEYLSDVGSWHEHIPFAYWVVENVKPELFVELGTHKGDSYFAFCQAIKTLNLKTKTFAIDTWEGDTQAGFYDSEIYKRVQSVSNASYSSFSTLLRMRFEEAVAQFADGSIDLLHIDGLHTYEAVKNDFETWLPKMSERGVILFHDLAVRKDDFGVWKLWDEIKGSYPSFSFQHGNGLGVLAVGKTVRAPVAALCASSASETLTTRELFHALGERISLLAGKAFEAMLSEAFSEQTFSLGSTPFQTHFAALPDYPPYVARAKRSVLKMFLTLESSQEKVAQLESNNLFNPAMPFTKKVKKAVKALLS